MADPTILVMAKDPFVAALLGALVEISGRKAAFPREGEPIGSALDRTAADLVLADCALGATACTSIANGARRDGSRLLMFSAAHTDREAHDIARRYGADVFVLPISPREFGECLAHAMSDRVSSVPHS
jgi:DNA-binding response OmpR family regulator